MKFSELESFLKEQSLKLVITDFFSMCMVLNNFAPPLDVIGDNGYWGADFCIVVVCDNKAQDSVILVNNHRCGIGCRYSLGDWQAFYKEEAFFRIYEDLRARWGG